MISNNERLKKLESQMRFGHCADSQEAVGKTHGDPARLMAVYLYYIRECTRKDFPDINTLRKLFGTETEPYGGYIDKRGEAKATRRMVFLGDCKCSTRIDGYGVHLAWVRHTSNVDIRLMEGCHLHIDCFDGSHVRIKAESPLCMCRVRVYGNAIVTIDGHTECVSIINTTKKTYH